MPSRLAFSLLALAAATLAGCASTHDAGRADYGKTYYIDGAGNWGFGTTSVAKALKEAGYPGSVEAYLWTTSFNPAIDQVNRPAARLRAAALSDKIRRYLKTYPDNDVNIIALSAGTGVAIWAVEALPPGMKVNNLVLLGSSLSSTYDTTRAFEHIKGRIYVYYSPADPILSGPVRILGTIDGSFDEPAGLVGLHGPRLSAVRTAPLPAVTPGRTSAGGSGSPGRTPAPDPAKTGLTHRGATGADQPSPANKPADVYVSTYKSTPYGYAPSAGAGGRQASPAAVGPAAGRIINIPWRPEYADYGWVGGHTDSTSEPFIRTFVAPHILTRTAPQRTTRIDLHRLRLTRPSDTSPGNPAPISRPLLATRPPS